MIPLYTNEQFNKAQVNDLLPCECKKCKKTFLVTKLKLKRTTYKSTSQTHDFCSNKCKNNYQQRNNIITNCACCGKQINKLPKDLKKSASGNLFCSSSCAAIYNNAHKTKGNKRSKLEIYIESKLLELYPKLEFQFNKKDAIDSELDIYIPSLKLAFELNGIFHYEPIYGNDKLNQIQNNDSNKFQKCIQAGISLCIIDTSKQKRFTELSSQQYLKIITTIINSYPM